MRFIKEYLLTDYQTRHNCDLSYAESKITASRFSTSRLSLPDCFLCRFFTTYLEQPYGLFPGRPIAQAVSIPHSPCVHCPPGVRFKPEKWFPAPASLYQVFLEALHLITVLATAGAALFEQVFTQPQKLQSCSIFWSELSNCRAKRARVFANSCQGTD